MPINKKQLTKEQVMQAMQCKNADELIALAKTGGIELTRQEAEAYLEEIEDFELDEDQLKKVAGGDFRSCWVVDNCCLNCTIAENAT